MSPERPIAYILGTFPQASQTFIAREIRGLRAAGLPLLVFALARRSADRLEPEDRPWYDQVCFAGWSEAAAMALANLRFLVTKPAAYLATFARLLGLPHRPRVMVVRAVGLFVIGAWIAHRIERAGGCRQVHAHFALAQTEVAMVVSGLLGCPFSFTAHARDIYATPSALEEKMRAASVVVTCTGYNAEYLRGLCRDLAPDHVRLVHHGVPLDAVHTGSERTSPPLILAAGRLIEKKGFDTLVDACALLAERQVPFGCDIYGTGPLLGALQERVRQAGLQAQVRFPGWAAPEVLRRAMGDATLFAMPSRITAGGDRDGIPNVVLEAMSAALPVVGTAVSGLPEAVVDGVTGTLVEPDDVAGLAGALERLLADASAAREQGAAGRRLAIQEFTIEASAAKLVSIFRGEAPEEPAMIGT